MAVSHLDATLLSRRIEHHVRGRNFTRLRELPQLAPWSAELDALAGLDKESTDAEAALRALQRTAFAGLRADVSRDDPTQRPLTER